MGYERHIPVMAERVTELLVTRRDGLYIDSTLGTGGHALFTLEHLHGSCRMIGLDRDARAITEARAYLAPFAGRVEFIQGNFADIGRLIGPRRCSGILADLGISSLQLADAERGFSYRSDGPLDMSMGGGTRSLRELISSAEEGQISLVIKRFGEERRHRAIAREIVRRRSEEPITTAGQLRAAVERAAGGPGIVATLSRVFQAFRIWVNGEIDALERFLPQAIELLEPGGRIVVISYHSLEDRIVKQFFKREEMECVCPPGIPECRCDKVTRLKIITRRPLRPTAREIELNQRARSAKLRAAERIRDEQTQR